MRYLYVACLAVAVVLVLSSLRMGWRPDSSQLGIKRKAELQASAREVEALCLQAQLAVQGVKAGDRCEDVARKLVKDYGEAMAATLRTACADGRMFVEKDLLFFPAGSLCERRDLPASCSGLCKRWRSGNEK